MSDRYTIHRQFYDDNGRNVTEQFVCAVTSGKGQLADEIGQLCANYLEQPVIVYDTIRMTDTTFMPVHGGMQNE